VKPVRTIVFAKAPQAGSAKTRLIPALGAQGAAALAHTMLLHTLSKALAAQLGTVELCVDPAPSDPVWQTFGLPTHTTWSVQGAGDLGVRMAHAAQRSINAGEAVLLIGTDCPDLSVPLLQEAAQALVTHDASIIPTFDGGYCLLGLQRFHSQLFDNIPWSTDVVAALTLQRIKELNWHVKVHPRLHDIDEPADIQWLPASWGYADQGKLTQNREQKTQKIDFHFKN
jgi:uncharacterized protein